MSTTVRKSGITGNINRWNTRGVFTLADGTAVAVVHDLNSATSFDATYGDRTGVEKVHIYSSADRNIWTLRASFSMGVTGGRVTANLAPDNTIGIVNWSGTVVRYASISPTTWIQSSWEVIRAALVAPINENNFDLSFTSGNVPIISALRSNTTGTTRLQLIAYVRRTSDSTWITTTVVAALEASTTPKTAYQEVSVAALIGGTAGFRNVVMAASHGTGTTDRGVKLYSMRVDEATGAITTITLRGTYAAGEVPGSTSAVSARNIMLFQSDTDEYTLGIQHLEGNKRYALLQGTYSGTTWTLTQPYIAAATTNNMVQYNMTMLYSAGTLSFVYVNPNGYILSYLARYDGEDETWRFSAGRWFDNKSRVTSYGLLANGGPNVQYPTNDLLFHHKIASNRQEIAHAWTAPLRPPVSVTPATGATLLSSTPVVRASADLDRQFPQSLVKMRWDFARDAAFTTSLVPYEQDDSMFKLVENTHTVGSVVPFSDVLPDDFELGQGIWFVRAAHVDEYGVVGQYSQYNSFTISHPPVAGALTPNGAPLLYADNVQVGWEFTDPSPTDTQTAFRVVVTRLDTNAVVHDSGKQASTDETYLVPMTTGLKDVALSWYVLLWDKDDVAGPASSTATFMVVDPPSAAITSPTAAQVLTTAIPNVLATVSVGGLRRVKKYQVKFTGTSAYTSPWVSVDLASGSQIDFQPPPELLLNNGTYSISVQVEDSLGLRSTATTVAVTTAWVPPATAVGVAVNTTPYNTEGQGWVAITWTDTGRDVDFTAWVVYRKENLLDPLTQVVLQAGTWTAIEEVTVTGATYTVKDYTASSGYQVQYRVEQRVIRFGDVVESVNGTVYSTQPVADSYWLIEPSANNAFRLGTIVSDQYTEEYEEADYVVIGRGSRYEQGERKGYRGTLAAQIRNTYGISARQHKNRLEEIKKGNRTLYLRNPFGDLFRVAVGGMSIDRVAGVGLSEFVNVSIPYFEVSE